MLETVQGCEDCWATKAEDYYTNRSETGVAHLCDACAERRKVMIPLRLAFPGEIVDVLDPWLHQVVCFRGKVGHHGLPCRNVRDERKRVHRLWVGVLVRPVPREEL